MRKLTEREKALHEGVLHTNQALRELDLVTIILSRTPDGQWTSRLQSATVLLSEAAQALRTTRDKELGNEERK